MPLQLSRGDRKILLIAGGVFLLLVAGGILFAAPEGNQSQVPTTYSASSLGAKAAYLLLQESGYRVERWEKSPTELAAGKNRTLILAGPTQFPNEQERTALYSFIRGGGRLVATGPLAGLILPESAAAFDPLQGMGWEKFEALVPSAIARAAPEITLEPQARWRPGSSALALYGNEDRTVVVRYPYGSGVILWWASATPLTNAGLKKTGNLEFFLACVGNKENTRVLWDEYFHGYGSSGGAGKGSPLVNGLLAQLAVLGAAILLTFSRRSGPVRPAAPEVRLSPLEFVETLGGLYEHAHASAVAVDVYYRRFQYWLTRRLGLGSDASVEELERAVRERWKFSDAEFAATLRACASARYHPELPPKEALVLVQTLHSYAEKLKLFPVAGKEIH